LLETQQGVLVIETQDGNLERACDQRRERFKVYDEKVRGEILQLPPDSFPIRDIIGQHAGIFDDGSQQGEPAVAVIVMFYASDRQHIIVFLLTE
jgi:hypothetical protein